MKSAQASALSAASLISVWTSSAALPASKGVRTVRKLRLAFSAIVALCAATTAADAQDTLVDRCEASTCIANITAAQLFHEAERLVSLHRFDDARPMLEALKQAPEYAMERRFLTGYAAIETGKVDEAIAEFRAILIDHPEQARVRMELARALEMKGKHGSAYHQYSLAQQSGNLPPEIARSINNARSLLRDKRAFSSTFEFGIAPDTNINNGSNTDVVNINFGPLSLPLTLDEAARKRSGIGQTVSAVTSYRTAITPNAKLLIDFDAQAVNYTGKSADDFALSFAAGPEITLSDKDSLSIQGIGAQRWYGGKPASTGGGIRGSFQREFESGARAGLTVDARYSKSSLSSAYSGWALGAYATYERGLGRSFVGSVNLFARRDDTKSTVYSGYEVGANLNVGGELPLGINAGLSGGVSRAAYDSAMTLFSYDPRQDWRMNARAYVGLRRIRVMGFSPSVTYNFSKVSSSLSLYDSDRHKVRFALARYF
jgi:outer membrane protein